MRHAKRLADKSRRKRIEMLVVVTRRVRNILCEPDDELDQSLLLYISDKIPNTK